MVTGGTGTAAIKTDYPIEEGLTLGSTKLKEDFYLIPEEDLLADEVGFY